MQEKRRYRRMNIEVSVNLEAIGSDNSLTGETIQVEVQDVSRNGLSFVCNEKLDMYACFAVNMTLWNGEGLNTIVKVVRGNLVEKGYEYGCIFVGLTDVDEFRIQVHEILQAYEDDEA